MKPFILTFTGCLWPREGAFFKSLAKEAKPGAIKPNGLKQRVVFIDKKVEGSTRHGHLKHPGNYALQTKHAQTHINRFLIEINNGVMR